MTDPRQRRASPIALALLSVVAILIVIIGVRAGTREVIAIRVSPVTHENLVSTTSTNGKVEPIDMFQAHAPAAGVVQKIYVDVGQKVKAGDLLLRLDDSDAVARVAGANAVLKGIRYTDKDQAQGGTQEERLANASELSRSTMQQQGAATSLATLEQLQGKGAASSSEVAAARERLDAANLAQRTAQQRATNRYSSSDRSRTQAQIADAEAAYTAAQMAYSRAVVRAPFAGTVYSIAVNPYDFVSGGEDLLDFADLNRMHVRAYFDEPEIGRLATGQAVKIVWDALPERIWHGHVEVAPTTVITYGTRNVGEALITVDDAHGDLRPNSNVTVTVTTKQRFNVLSVPREALHTEGAISFVYRVVNHRLQRTGVQVGALNFTRVEIVSGLSEKDTVALNATSNRDLVNGLEVKAVE